MNTPGKPVSPAAGLVLRWCLVTENWFDLTSLPDRG